MRFYKDHYDVVIIGGALAGMAAALQLQAKGVRDILILEKHNMPGGVATDYMRDGFEMEASLHEMMSIGPKGKRLKVGQFFDDMGIAQTAAYLLNGDQLVFYGSVAGGGGLQYCTLSRCYTSFLLLCKGCFKTDCGKRQNSQV